MNKIISSIALSAVSFFSFAAPSAQFTTDKFDNFTLHTYASFDPMADVSFIVESDNKLVVIEPQAFKGHVEEFTEYTERLGKPVEKVLVSFHAAGLKVYNDEHKVITQPMADFMKSDAAKGMLGYFGKAFKGAMDTEVVAFDEVIDANSEFTVDGVSYELEPTSVPGMPGVNIAINDKVYYQHFAPAKGFHVSEHLISNKASIDLALQDSVKAKKAGYILLIGSHGFGKGAVSDLEFQIKYLKKMKKIATKAETSEAFIEKMNKAFPDLKGQNDLNQIAKKLYKS